MCSYHSQVFRGLVPGVKEGPCAMGMEQLWSDPEEREQLLGDTVLQPALQLVRESQSST